MKKNGNGMIIYVLIALIILTSGIGMGIFLMQKNLLSGVQKNVDERTYDRYYAFIVGDDSDFWQDVYNGARTYGEKNNVYVENFGTDLAGNYTEEERIDIAVAAGVDGIIAEGVQKSSLKKSIEKANEAGIPVVLVGEDLVDTPRVSFVGVGQYDLGELYGRQAAALSKKILNKKEKVRVTVLSSSGKPSEGERLIISTIRKVISSDADLYGRATVDFYPIGDEGLFSSQEMVYDFLMAEDVPDVIIALSREHTVSVYQAVVDLNLVGECNIIGYHDSETIKNAIKNEVIYSTIATDTQQYGKYAADALNEQILYGNVNGYYSVDNRVLDAAVLLQEDRQ